MLKVNYLSSKTILGQYCLYQKYLDQYYQYLTYISVKSYISQTSLVYILQILYQLKYWQYIFRLAIHNQYFQHEATNSLANITDIGMKYCPEFELCIFCKYYIVSVQILATHISLSIPNQYFEYEANTSQRFITNISIVKPIFYQ